MVRKVGFAGSRGWSGKMGLHNVGVGQEECILMFRSCQEGWFCRNWSGRLGLQGVEVGQYGLF